MNNSYSSIGSFEPHRLGVHSDAQFMGSDNGNCLLVVAMISTKKKKEKESNGSSFSPHPVCNSTM